MPNHKLALFRLKVHIGDNFFLGGGDLSLLRWKTATCIFDTLIRIFMNDKIFQQLLHNYMKKEGGVDSLKKY